MSDTLTLAELAFLQSERGEKALHALAGADLSEQNTLALVMQLRQTLEPSEAAAALTMARLRQRAVAKYGEIAPRLFFTPSALEQASDPLVRAYRAQFAAHQRVLDVCCGIGTDTIALAQVADAVMGLDIDPVRIEIARHNARVYDATAQFSVADVLQGIPDSYDMIFYDPARRDEAGKRIYDVDQYVPPLSLIENWQARQIVVKLSPGVDREQLGPYGSAVEFISVNGDLKEAVLWRGADWQGTQATLLTEEATYHFSRESEEPDVPLQEPAGYLVEPDPAILRAGLVRDLAAHLGGALLDETIAYMTTLALPQSPWVRAWEIEDWMPYNLKKLRAYLRERDVGRITVKKRGSPVTPEQLTASLKLKKGHNARTLVLTRLQNNPIVIICAEQPTRLYI
ncbi:methyltransferase domain-containing protein [Phototrophicus methaneseepsis]|uniref:Methyltransferase domain-containing protein n=1 Tax=Phototrophicus methaneseepsis TaxID=2710758 RepID=A0A7S8IDT7_9CHLR|nr:class I SAM-dependent methyltransferase [Phototrophicus methaneseepsis]QPC81886.1 methyltransferase domain-containing protein [Phototrophicus methaneseepsis]